MAVYEHSYQRYTGSLTTSLERFLVIPRYAFRSVLQPKGMLIFLALSSLPFLFGAAAVYLTNSSKFAELLSLTGGRMNLEVSYGFFNALLSSELFFAFLLMVFVAPSLIAPDLRNNALPLYLSRPFSRKEYVLGKLTVLAGLMSVMTWIPLALLYVLQAALHQEGWWRQHLDLLPAILLISGAWILVLSLVGLAASAWVKWKAIARLTLFAFFFGSAAVAAMINALFSDRFETDWGSLISPFAVVQRIQDGLLHQELASSALPAWAAWGSLLALSALALGMLARKVRAYEVV